ELQIDASLYTLLQILSVSVFEKNQLQQALQQAAYIPEQYDVANQLNLFNF
ncbi:MAG: IS4 family transposase, partial [Nitrosomonas sp.]|nr:IS4 family transposase [Nitrosomonas sp.]